MAQILFLTVDGDKATPVSGRLAVYAKKDNKIYVKDANGNVAALLRESDLVELGGGFQTVDPTLTALATAGSASNKFPFYSADNVVTLADLSVLGRQFLAQTTVEDAQQSLNLTPGQHVQAFDASTAKTNVPQTFSEVQTFTGGMILQDEVREVPVVEALGATYTVDLSRGTIFDLTLTTACSLTFPNPNAGRQFTLFLQQDSAGQRVVNWPSNCRWPGDVVPTLTTTANKTDTLSFIADGTYWLSYMNAQNFTRS